MVNMSLAPGTTGVAPSSQLNLIKGRTRPMEADHMQSILELQMINFDDELTGDDNLELLDTDGSNVSYNC